MKLFELFNMEKDSTGKWFALCSECERKNKVPDNCIRREIGIAKKGTLCSSCDSEAQ